MTPFGLKKLNKKLTKVDLSNKSENYSIKPFIQNWIKEHPPELSYPLKNKAESINDWKHRIKEKISSTLKVIDPLPLNEANIIIHNEAEANNIRFIKLSLQALPHLRVPAVLCIPESINLKTPAVICIHGHEQSIYNSIGIKKSKGKEYFGYELAQKGIITISIDWIGSGERETFRNRFLLFMRSENTRSNWMSFLGLDMLSLRITEVKAILNYLETIDKVDPNRLGIIGHSGGGTLSLFSSVLDDRIKACGITGYFGTWEDSILAMFHCGCNYSGDLAKYMELYDVYASLAPLPVAVAMGRKDGIYPIIGTEKAIPIIKKAYAERGNPENFLIDIQPGKHRFYGEKIYPFLLNNLSS